MSRSSQNNGNYVQSVNSQKNDKKQSLDYQWLVICWSCPRSCSGLVSNGQCYWSSDDILCIEEHPKLSNILSSGIPTIILLTVPLFQFVQFLLMIDLQQWQVPCSWHDWWRVSTFGYLSKNFLTSLHKLGVLICRQQSL